MKRIDPMIGPLPAKPFQMPIFICHHCTDRQNQGQIQDFFEGVGAQIKDMTTVAPVGTRGVRGGCTHSEVEKRKCNFQSQLARFGAFFLPEAPTQRCPISAKSRGGPGCLYLPLNLPLKTKGWLLALCILCDVVNVHCGG